MRDDELMHYGTKYHSGRYPYGSGDNPFQHDDSFLLGVRDLEKKGISEKEIADFYGMTTNELRKRKSNAIKEEKTYLRGRIEQLQAEGKSNSEIGRILGKNESTIRSLMSENSKKRQAVNEATINVLKKNVKEKRYLDVGDGVASGMGITKTRLDTAVQSMVDEGYSLHKIKVPQVTNPGKFTQMVVLCEPGVTWDELRKNKEKIGLVDEKFTEPSGTNLLLMRDPIPISSKRVQVLYGPEGGETKDGLIEIRPGAKDLDLGNSHYAQVRIAVDGTHYLKGVAVYSNDLPDGVDIRFNTNKKNTGNPLDAMKPFKKDPDNPFGSTIKDQRGALNIVGEEGDWQEWSRTLSSQFLSKQSVKLAQQQLNFAEQQRKLEYSEILALSNPTVRKHMLEEFAEKCDTAAVHLKAASMPGQSNSLILPVNSLKPNEVYAPNYKNGTQVVLIRHPHGGTFEIPQLVVNNRNKEARAMMGPSNDAIGIHFSVAAQLSGADFDGDTVVVIPNDSRKIRTRKPFAELQDFDPKIYALPEGSPTIKPDTKQREMGVVSNLITDMTLQKAPDSDVIKAVRHSMVVIDSEKHHLDYIQSAKDNEIEQLKKRYQQKPESEGKKKYGGASTLISRAKSEVRVPERRMVNRVDPNTGEKIFYPTNRTYVDKHGNTVLSMEKSTQMREAKDAFSLVSSANNGTGTVMERVYAKYANSMKAMANSARKQAVNTKETSYSPEARSKYEAEVQSLNKKLINAKAWSPKERNAQIFADYVYRTKLYENPEMTDETKKKVKTQALTMARSRLGGKKPQIIFEGKEWEAVQAGAISKTKLSEILRYADSDQVKELALPKSVKSMTPAKISIARAKINAGYSWEEVAKMLNVSRSTLERALKE